MVRYNILTGVLLLDAETRDAAYGKLNEAKSDAAARWDATKNGAEKRYDDMRATVNGKYEDAKDEAARLRADAEKKYDETKSGWFSWWGSTKACLPHCHTSVYRSSTSLTL